MKNARLSAPSPNTGYVPGCPFCDIDPVRTTVVGSFSFTKAVLSNPCLAPGHLLLIPRRHVERLSDLHPVEREELVTLLIRYQEVILHRLTPGCDVRQNYHPFEPAGDIKVDHLHVHLIPRSLDDELYQRVASVEDSLFQMVTPQERHRFLALYQLGGPEDS